jgi:5-hydroxyisourate hydrolase-like protein (transthyretin family)
VTIVESFDPGSPLRRRVSTARTDADGRYAANLEPGPSRAVSVEYGGSARASATRSRSLRVGVHPRVSLAVSASIAAVGGPPIVFRGKVDALPGEIPPDGVAVELEFKVPGGKWSEFRTVRTDRRGRFRYRYRFSDDDSRGVRFRFRASAPTQSDWPYEPGGSRPVAVRGA